MLHGRRHEVAELDRLLDGLTRGRPFVLAISGEPGSGRSALLDEARERAAAHGMRVLATRGDRGLGPAPAFDGLATLLRPLVRRGGDRLRPLGDALGAGDGETADLAALRAAVLDAITAAAEERPTVLLLDDADGLDPSSADALAFCLGRLGVDRVGALATSTGPGPFDDVATDTVHARATGRRRCGRARSSPARAATPRWRPPSPPGPMETRSSPSSSPAA